MGMRIYINNDLKEYMKNDWILKEIEKNETEEERKVRTNQWLKEIEAKRMIYADVYGDFLQEKNNSLRVLDVGGGYNSLTKVMAQNINYTLCDFLAHGGHNAIASNVNWINDDWNHYYDQIIQGNKKYDVIVANDIFPDVDQRMEMFIEKSLKIAKEIRLVVTFYNEPKFYLTKRVDDSEIMTFLSWDGEITALKLGKFLNSEDFTVERRNEMIKTKESVFRNGRQVAYIVIKGENNA